MEVQGKLKRIFNTQDITASFKKREFVITTQEQYPQDILIEFTQDKCDILNSFREGQDVKVQINIRGRQWINPKGEERYFNTIQAWKIELQKEYSNNPDVDDAPTFADDNDDSLPF